MNKNAKAWVEALRSGEYSQGTAKLSDKHYSVFGQEYEIRHCCLGVACQLYKKTHPEFKAVVDEDGTYRYGTMGERYYLPIEVMKWLNVRDQNGMFSIETGETESLSSMNDSGSTFEEIANKLEEDPAGLFNTKKSLAKLEKVQNKLEF